jgi:predicted Na+-dependent transporter
VRALAAVPRRLTPVALLAAVAALAVPSRWLAGRSDELLALLVFLTALGIPWGALARLRTSGPAIAALSVAPFVPLTGVAWLLGRAFGGGVRDGLLATGLASSEVASVGLVALAGADATIALGIVTGSLIVAAIVGPIGVSILGSGHVDGAALLGRFALVVIAPLIAGVAIRTVAGGIERYDDEREGAAALTVAVLVYAALSGAEHGPGLSEALVASAAFLAISTLLGSGWLRLVSGPVAVPGALTIGMRDFAVAAALASQGFGAQAGTVPGIYGVLMLVAGSAAAGLFRRRSG